MNIRYAQNIIGFERNKHAEGDEKNLSRLRLLKDRNYGQTGYIHLKYDINTGKMDEFDPEQVSGESEFNDDVVNTNEKPF